MLKKNTGIFQILITLLLILCTFISRYNVLVHFVSIFFISAAVSYCICNFSFLKTLYMSGCAIIFYVVASFANRSFVPADAITLSVLFLPGFALGLSFKAKFSFRDTFFIVLLIYALILIASLAISKLVYGINITAQIRDIFLGDFDDNINILTSISPEAFEQLKTNEHQIFNALYIFMPGLIPFIFGVVFVITSLIQYGISKMLCMKYLIQSCAFKDGFDCFRPGIVTNITLVLMIITVMYETSQNAAMICINAVLIILLIYFVTTLSLIEHKLKQHGLYPGKRFAILAAVVVLALIFSLVVPVVNFIFIFVFLGFLDSLLDFRKLKIKKVD